MTVAMVSGNRWIYFRTFVAFFLFISILWFAVSEGKEDNWYHSFDEGAEFEKRDPQPSTCYATQITEKFFCLKNNRKNGYFKRKSTNRIVVITEISIY